MFNPLNLLEAAGLDAVSDWIITGISDLFGIGSTNSARRYNNKVMDTQFEYAQKLAEQQQAYNKENLGLQTEGQKDLFNFAFNKNTEYNSPTSQIERLQQAGINPNVLFNGSNPNVAQSASAGSVGLPSAGLPSTPSGMNIPIQSMSANARDAARLALETRRTDKDLEVLSKTLEGMELDNLTKAQWLEIIKKTGLDKASAEVKLLIQKAIESDSNSKKMLAEKDLIGFKQETEKVIKSLNEALKDLNDKQKERLQIEIDNLDAYYKSVIRSNEGSAASGFASAAVNNQEAHTKALYNKVYDKYNITNKEGINLFESAVLSALRRPEVQNDLDEQTRKKIEDTLPIIVEQMKQDLENNDMRSWPAYIRLFGNLAGKTAADGLIFMLMK